MATNTSSATSLNFIGFDEMKGNGTPDLLYNRVVILPLQPQTAGKWIQPLAGYIPGQQPYLKRRVQLWNKPLRAVDKRLATQGYSRYEKETYM